MFPTGFTTGYLAHGSGGLQIDLDVTDAQVRALNTEGAAAAFPLRECLSVSDCYDRFVDLLENVGHPCPIYPVPQEMFTDEPFYHLDEPLAFDDLRAQAYFDQCLFARDALLEFSAPWRGKKTPPSLYWGTFDMTCVLFSGEPCPFDSEASLVERVALDEQLVEFGILARRRNVRQGGVLRDGLSLPGEFGRRGAGGRRVLRRISAHSTCCPWRTCCAPATRTPPSCASAARPSHASPNSSGGATWRG